MKLTRFCRFAIVVIALSGGLVLGGQVKADVIGFDDFEGLEMQPFTEAGGVIDLGQGGLDWTRNIPGWSVDNTLMNPPTMNADAYNGWSAWNVDAWFVEQGDQGRGTCGCLGLGTGNTCLVADPDAWDDFGVNLPSNGYNSYISRTYDLTGFNQNSLVISFDYEFRVEDSQEGTVEVSFDGGATWQELLHFGPVGDDFPDGSYFFDTPGMFSAGTDFNASSSQLILRFGCFNAGNDWWFAIDNVSVTTGDGFNEFEDFEGLTLEPFSASVGDGTDWSEEIPNWVIDNSGTVDSNGVAGFSKETAYDGWKAVDVFGWVEEQGGDGRTLFNVVDPNNTVLLADGDAFFDYDCDTNGNGYSGQVNTYVSREYCLSGYDVNSVKISFLYEFRIENQQLGVAEISFDGGATWTRLLEFDNNDGANGDYLQGLAEFNAGTDFTATPSGTMILRFGYLMSGNNWWFAIDDVMVEANPDPATVLPCEVNVINGNQTGGTVADVATSNDTDLVVRRSNSSIAGVIDLEFKGVSQNPNPSNFEFTLEAAGFFRFTVTQSIQLYDYDAGAFVEVDLRNASQFVDSTVVVNGTGDLGRFVENGTGCVRARILYTSSRPRQSFSVNIDKACWAF